jgi:hypothetical protein
MIASIFSAIAALPKLLEALEKLVGWISVQITAAKKKKLEEELAKAIELSKEKKDTSGLDQLFDPTKKP